MNKRVTKLLTRYAPSVDMNIKELKLWWNSMSWQERTEARKRIEEELGISSESDTEETAEE